MALSPIMPTSAAVAPAFEGDGGDEEAGTGVVAVAARPDPRAAARRVVRVVLGLAVVSSGLLFFGGLSGWTRRGSTSFEAGAGVLLGLACASVPYSVVGLVVAYGPQSFEARNRIGFSFLVLLPSVVVVCFAVLSLVAKTKGMSEARSFGEFFGAAAVVVAGLGTHGSWYLVAAANASPLVPPAAAGRLGTACCLCVLMPLGVALPLVLLRGGGAAADRWGDADTDSTAGSARPPRAVAACLVVPVLCVSCLGHPVLRVARLRRPLFEGGRAPRSALAALRGVGCLRRPFRATDAVLACCVLAFFALCFVGDGRAPGRLCLGALVLGTQAALHVAAKHAARRGDERKKTRARAFSLEKKERPPMRLFESRSLAFLFTRRAPFVGERRRRGRRVEDRDEDPRPRLPPGPREGDSIQHNLPKGKPPRSQFAPRDDRSSKDREGHTIEIGTWQMLAAQVFVLGLCLRRYGDRDWYAPLAVACFGGFGAVVAALLGVEAARGEAADDRFRAATVAVAFCVLPWWGVSLRTGGDGGALGTVAVACGALPGLAACADAWASRGAIARGPRVDRSEALRLVPHVLLLFVLCYVAVVLLFTDLRGGGRGVFAAVLVLAPAATWSGLDEARRRATSGGGGGGGDSASSRSSSRGNTARKGALRRWTARERALAASWVPLGAVLAFLVATGQWARVGDVDRSLAGEFQAFAVFLAAAAPSCAAAWDLVFLSARLWTRGGSPKRDGLLATAGYYARLVADAAGGVGADDELANDAANAAPALGASKDEISRPWYAKLVDLEISRAEAVPAFSALICCLVLLPFGVFGPLFFLAAGKDVPIVSKSQLMGLLVAAVFLMVLILTTSANASMTRLKEEAKSKVASYALRLALRRERVVCTVTEARVLFEERDRHVQGALAAFRSSRPSRRRASLGAKSLEAVQDAADAALRNDLARSRTKVEARAELDAPSWTRRATLQNAPSPSHRSHFG